MNGSAKHGLFAGFRLLLNLTAFTLPRLRDVILSAFNKRICDAVRNWNLQAFIAQNRDADRSLKSNSKVTHMYIAIEHDIHDPEKFRKCAEDVFPLPDDLHVHQFYPSTDMSKAVCLYEAPSIERLSDYLDSKLSPASTQRYFPVLSEHAIGLPERVTV